MKKTIPHRQKTSKLPSENHRNNR